MKWHFGPLGSIYKDQISLQVMKIAEAGLKDKYYDDEMNKVAVLNENSKKVQPHPVDIAPSTRSVFSLLVHSAIQRDRFDN